MFRITKLIVALAFISGASIAHPGIGIVEDSRGNIFYTDLEQVWKITPGGQRSVAVRNVHTHELFLDSNDNLFGEHLWYNGEAKDTWGHFAWTLTKNGQFQKIIPDTEGFLENYSFVRDHFGRMYWADRGKGCQHVIRKNRDNTTTPVGDECLENIRWMISTSDGTIYVVDNNEDLKKIDNHGKTSKVFKVASAYAGAPTLDKNNNIYMSDFSGRKITRIAPDGTRKIVVRTTAPWGPMALIVTSNGDYAVLETSTTNQVRVERISMN